MSQFCTNYTLLLACISLFEGGIHQVFIGEKHFIPVEVRVGSFALIQYDNGVADMVMHKIKPEVGLVH